MCECVRLSHLLTLIIEMYCKASCYLLYQKISMLSNIINRHIENSGLIKHHIVKPYNMITGQGAVGHVVRWKTQDPKVCGLSPETGLNSLGNCSECLN